MKVSTKGRYGLRVMVELAVRHGQGPVSADAVAAEQCISEKYIHVLVTGLRAAGLVRAVRGPHGGYVLAREPKDISALEILSVLEGPTEPAPCAGRSDACRRSGQCAAREVWLEVASAVDSTLHQFSLDKLAARHRELQQPPDHYEI